MIINILFKILMPSFIFACIFALPKALYVGNVQWSEILYKTIGGHTYWFTSALALGQLIIAFIIFKISRNTIIIYIISLAISTIPLCISMGNFDPWYYQEGLNCVSMVATGGIFYKIADRLKQWSSKGTIIVLCIVYLIGITIIPGIKSLVYGCDINALGYAFAIISFVVLVKLMDSMPKFKLFDYIGNNSIVFYFFSGIYPALFAGQLSKITSLPPIVVLLLSLILSIAAATLTTVLIMRYCPWLTDLRKLKIHKNS